MNPVFNKPQLKREEIAFELAKIKSPLTILFKQIYPKSQDGVKEKLLPILDKISSTNENELDDYEMFAIVYYIFRVISTYPGRIQITQNMFEGWKEYIKSKYGAEVNIEFDLRISGGIIFDFNNVDLRVVESMKDYLDLLDEIRTSDKKIFFRGHGDISYRLLPSIFRNEVWFRNEKKMYQELQINCPNEFSRLKNHLEILAEMQHYGLPTRLLDITQNPLVALYFACEECDTYTGEVIIFATNKDGIKYPQSDTVAVLASLPLFTNKFKMNFMMHLKIRNLQ